MAERTKVADKVFLDAQGEESRHASQDTTKLEFRFTDGTVREVDLEKIGAKCKAAALWHGLSQKLGDSYAGAKGVVGDAIESLDTVLERLANDDWVKAGEGPGTRPSLVADAIKAALEKAGQTVDEERYATIREKVKGNENRKAALAIPEVAVEYERLRLEAQQARFAKMSEAAAASGGAGLAAFTGEGAEAPAAE